MFELSFMTLLAWFLALLSVSLLLISAWGLVRLPDALSRQHAATKAASIALSLFIISLLIYALSHNWGIEWVLRLTSLLLLLLIFLPIASHALARSAIHEHPLIEKDTQ